MESLKTGHINFFDFEPKKEDFCAELLKGLAKREKSVSSKFFYDEKGSQIFTKICELDEYYPTRTEIGILSRHGQEISKLLGENCLVIELGSGDGKKVRLLLDCLKNPFGYMAIDISKEILLSSLDEIVRAYPSLEVTGVCADYINLSHFKPVAQSVKADKKVIFFPGSTIGNLLPSEATQLLNSLSEILNPGDGFLIGVDLQKSSQILNSAYNDKEGVTAEFNLNLLTRANRELNANFDLESFAHQAFYDASLGRVEMRLVSLKDQSVIVGGKEIHFQEAESIHTENSHKYDVAGFRSLATAAGLVPVHCWTDSEALFSVHFLKIPDTQKLLN